MCLISHQQSKPSDNSTQASSFQPTGTWLKSIKKKNFIGWPLFTAENVESTSQGVKRLQMGHMNHQRQSVRLTKPKEPTLEEPDATQEVGKKERYVYLEIVDLWDLKSTIYTDQTGKFPVKA